MNINININYKAVQKLNSYSFQRRYGQVEHNIIIYIERLKT